MKKKVIEEKIELAIKHEQWLSNIDFIDTFSTTNHVNNIQEITDLVFNTTPTWIKFLFALRNKIVGIFGLKTGKPTDFNEDFKVGGYVKFFKIYSIAENEIVLGADDTHLNFRALVINTKSECYNIQVTTLVQYNNLLGRGYMAVIKPFHRQVVKRMVMNAFKG